MKRSMMQFSAILLGLCMWMPMCATVRVYDHIIQETPGRNKEKKVVQVSAFDQIESEGVADITFNQSDKTEVVIIGPKNSLPFITVQSVGGVLKINTRKIGNKRIGKGVEVKVSAPALKRILNKGVGNIRFIPSLKTNSLQVNNYGVGNIHLPRLECTNLTVSNQGVGNLYFSGKAEKASFQLEGVGDVNARELKALHVELQQKGVGDMSYYAAETIKISSKGAGNVVYYGHPRVLEFSKKGVGSVEAK